MCKKYFACCGRAECSMTPEMYKITLFGARSSPLHLSRFISSFSREGGVGVEGGNAQRMSIASNSRETMCV